MVIERRNKWFGISIGACLIAVWFYITVLMARPGNVLLFFFIFTFIIALIGGLIAGILTQGDGGTGIWSGFWSGLFGACAILVYFLSIVIFDTLAGTVTLATGFALYGGIFIAIFVIMLATIGGKISTVINKTLIGDSTEKPESTQEQE
ncbi:MFS family permease [Methanolinea mesophila]|uniref:hypothetical protein n=1 Tax=Methanolinea mesophila TaxID=547055 RepID=UPI001AE47ED2|nr:hypothetical protein [Methanolinea mesophila]MBP1928694.1 MFS family permease [Methanolinea mesophila]